MNLSLTPWTGNPSTLVYEKVNLQVMPYTIAEPLWMAKLNELKASVDWENLSDDERAGYSGQAMAGTICTDFKQFTIPAEDGQEEVTVSFDGKPSDERYSTQAEQLLSQDVMLRTAIFNHSYNRSNFRDKQERQALGE